MGKLDQRLAALEKQWPDDNGHAAAEASCEDLLAFLKAAFPADLNGCRMDDLARCCGLPNAGAMREVLEMDLDERAFREVAASRYGGDWQGQMQCTMGEALHAVRQAHGPDGPLDLASLFPPLLAASAVATSPTYSGDAA